MTRWSALDWLANLIGFLLLVGGLTCVVLLAGGLLPK